MKFRLQADTFDAVDMVHIKTRAATFAPLMTRFIALSFNEGKFPEKFKALVTRCSKRWTGCGYARKLPADFELAHNL